MAGCQNIEQSGRCAGSDLFSQIVDFENLYKAAYRARKGKRNRHEVAEFFFNLDENLIQLQNELLWGSYQTGVYHNFYVYEPKKRLVAALPFRDRVVQHSIVAAIEPIFEKRFIYDSYACRVGKGTHAGADRAQRFLRDVQRRCGKIYALKADISKYFASIDRETLKKLISQKISCKKTLSLISAIIDSSPGENGIPIGNLTSQLCANIYLHELDWYAKHTLSIKRYIRYMDDFVVVHHDKRQLHQWRADIERFLLNYLRLKTNHKTQVFPVAVKNGRALDFLGYRIYPTHRLLRKCSIKRIKTKIKKYKRQIKTGELSITDAGRKLQSWIGHASHCNSYGLRKALLSKKMEIS